MTRLVALQEIYICGRNQNAGDEFEIPEQEAAILVGLAYARRADPVAAAPVQTRDMKAEETPQPKIAEATGTAGGVGNPEPVAPQSTENTAPLTQPKRRQYKRRDMRAED